MNDNVSPQKMYSSDFDDDVTAYKDVTAFPEAAVDPTPGVQPAFTSRILKAGSSFIRLRNWAAAAAPGATIVQEIWRFASKKHLGHGAVAGPDAPFTDDPTNESAGILLAQLTYTYSGRACVNRNPLTGVVVAATTFYAASGYTIQWLLDPDVVFFAPDGYPPTLYYPATDRELLTHVDFTADGSLYVRLGAVTGAPSRALVGWQRVA